MHIHNKTLYKTLHASDFGHYLFMGDLQMYYKAILTHVQQQQTHEKPYRHLRTSLISIYPS